MVEVRVNRARVRGGNNPIFHVDRALTLRDAGDPSHKDRVNASGQLQPAHALRACAMNDAEPAGGFAPRPPGHNEAHDEDRLGDRNRLDRALVRPDTHHHHRGVLR
jgi:hypothetical protein